MSPDIIDIDDPGESLIELAARVELAAGLPVLLPSDRPAWHARLRKLVGTPVRVLLFVQKRRRSLAQNRLLWRVYAFILRELRAKCLDDGIDCPFRTKEDLHAAFKHAFIGVSVVEFRGDRMEIPPTSTRLTTVQFSRYLEQVVQRAALWGIYVPMPDDDPALWREAA